VTTAPTGTVWYYEGETFGHRVLHIFNPATGLLVIVSANSNSTSDDLIGLAVSVLQTLQTGQAHATTPMTAPPAVRLS
jgi:D-alanyl-D-alanine carboxypeptidase